MKTSKSEYQFKQEVKELDTIGKMCESVESLQNIAPEKYFASGVIVTVHDLSGNLVIKTVVYGDFFDQFKSSLIDVIVKTIVRKNEFIKNQLSRAMKIIEQQADPLQ